MAPPQTVPVAVPVAVALAPIGSSMVHLLGGPSFSLSEQPPLGTSARHATPNDHRTASTLPAMPCLLLPRALGGGGSDSDSSSHGSRRRILLQGPSQSGRTSLAMNLAYACAAGEAAEAMVEGVENHVTTTATATSTSLPSCHYCLLQPCQCTNVVVYRKAAELPPNQNFPLPCRYCSSGGDTNPLAWKCDNAAFLNEDSTTPFQWDPTILRRIRIQYVRSARDILQDLLGLLGKPVQEHPTRAIIFDDLDQICGGGDWEHSDKGRSSSSSGSGTSDIAISIMQTLAVAVDTSHVLERRHGELPFVLATASCRTKIVAPWMDTIVTLSSASPLKPNRNRGLPNNYSPQSHWTADFRGTSGAAAGGRRPWSTTVDYSVLNHSLDGPCIEWKTPRA